MSLGASIEDVAMSSSREVAASNLWIIVVSSVLETVGKTLSSMIDVFVADQQLLQSCSKKVSLLKKKEVNTA